MLVYTVSAPTAEARRVYWLPVIFLAGIAALFAVQLVPLPYEAWAQLPGRQFAADILQTARAATGARPLTMDAERTVSSGLSLLPAAAMLLAAVKLSDRDRLILGFCVIGAAALSFLLGAAQAISGTGAAALTLFNTSNVGQPIGLFANSNHQAILLLVGFVFAGLLMPRLKGPQGRWRYTPIPYLALGAAFLIAIVLNNSRTVMLLIPVAVLAVAVRHRTSNRAIGPIIGLAAVAIGLAVLASFSQSFFDGIASFANLDDARYGIWPDVVYAIEQFGWAGAGIGTFEPVFKTVETLGLLGPHFINHAHNDYLEFVLEAGALGVLLIGFYLAIFALACWNVLRAPRGTPHALAYAGLVSIILLMIHSLVDYPLRTPLLSTLFALCWAMVLACPKRTVQDQSK